MTAREARPPWTAVRGRAEAVGARRHSPGGAGVRHQGVGLLMRSMWPVTMEHWRELRVSRTIFVVPAAAGMGKEQVVLW